MNKVLFKVHYTINVTESMIQDMVDEITADNILDYLSYEGTEVVTEQPDVPASSEGR